MANLEPKTNMPRYNLFDGVQYVVHFMRYTTPIRAAVRLPAAMQYEMSTPSSTRAVWCI